MSRHHHNPNWPRIVRAVRRRDRDRPCLFCDLPVVLGHVHHVVHVEDGGTDDLDNLRLVCATCHARHHQEECAAEVSPEFAAWDAYLRDLVKPP